jgi:hypothetical protein
MKKVHLVINESEIGMTRTSTQWQYASGNINFFKLFNVQKEYNKLNVKGMRKTLG